MGTGLRTVREALLGGREGLWLSPFTTPAQREPRGREAQDGRRVRVHPAELFGRALTGWPCKDAHNDTMRCTKIENRLGGKR